MGAEMKKYRLDKEEQEILRSYKNGEWKPIKLSKSELNRYAQIARNTRLKKNIKQNLKLKD